MKKIALPVTDKKLNSHFGQCQYFKIYTVQNLTIIKEELLQTPVLEPGLIPLWLLNKKVTDVIVCGIGHKAIEIFNQHKINVFVGVQVKEPMVLVQEYLNGVLETNGNLCNH